MSSYRNIVIKYFFIALLFSGAPFAHASIIDGTIDSAFHTVQVCEDTTCPVTATSPVNFGYFTTSPSSNIHVLDTGLTGFVWGSSFGWVVLNCANTASGCTSTNGSFKVANDKEGHLTGYAWGENAGWINFGPFSNNIASKVFINNIGEFNGYAWSQNFGWIKFQCPDANYCVKTDWRPQHTRPGCSDGIDNDSDGLIDSADPGCHTDSNPSNQNSYNPTDAIEFSNNGSETTTSGSESGTGTGESGTGTGGTNGTGSGTSGSGTSGGAGGTGTNGESTTGTGEGGTTTGNAISTGITTITEKLVSILDTIGRSVTYFFGGNPDEGRDIGTLINQSPIVGEVIQTLIDATRGAGHAISQAARTTLGQIIIMTIVISVVALGLLFGILISIGAALFIGPLSFSEFFLIPSRFRNVLFASLGLRKHRHELGTIYDSITKTPLDPSYVTLMDMQGKEISTSITNINGRYGFLVAPGTYQISVHKTNYSFPSIKLAGQENDEIYNDLYFGGPIEIGEDGSITKNIPLDPTNFDWNNFAAIKKTTIQLSASHFRWLVPVANVIFNAGLVLSTLAFIALPNGYNTLLFLVYGTLYVLKHTVLKPRSIGSVKEKTSGKPLAFAVVRVFSLGVDQEVAHTVTDKLGVYHLTVPKGTYYVKIEKKNPDESYSLTYTSEPLMAKKGTITSHFKV